MTALRHAAYMGVCDPIGPLRALTYSPGRSTCVRGSVAKPQVASRGLECAKPLMCSAPLIFPLW